MIELEHRQFQCPGYYIRAASKPFEARGAEALRRRVFVEEQRIFQTHDRDEIDLVATHLVALSTYAHEADQVVGTVRIHEERPGLWWGSRLAVDSDFRQVGRLGTELIRLAVCTANARGCDAFLAHVQMQNVPLFRRLKWTVLEEVTLHGVPHARMSADLSFYPPCEDPAAGWFMKPGRRA
ncbi:GNAT family N-acetyltransferase [Sulfitobacter sp. G21635-S1]|jgi:putative N-acetyltransferase (TIGR04045 family)|uniref:MSMEG_0567/Sll0786 family nitrogen starvation N-acetyltransferase n=1 Tax=Sulfitobacter sp. G21635-S1 TaxID=3014043 RepID=UPI0022AFCE32|nr:MSMEG_0567/Sll0786 family nitrogen starvation N-acetyltransferase [Sulfitobacter sp. G21635-S1]MCZ4255617.1 GNAT family N-acetyltransferase [Sulfitobacter sp. G21635-S1]